MLGRLKVAASVPTRCLASGLPQPEADASNVARHAPDLPTVAESGYPGFEAGTWYAFLGPAGLPAEVQAKLATDIVTVTQMADVRARFKAMGVDPIGTTPEQLAAIMRADLEKWTRVIRAANIKLE